MIRGFGWLPDPDQWSPRKGKLLTRDDDYRFAATGPIPARTDLDHLVADVLDQLDIGSCVANAGFQAVRMNHVQNIAQKMIDGGTWAPSAYLHARTVSKLGARLFGYYASRAYHGMQDLDTGTHLRTFFWVLNKFGFLPEAEYEYGYDTSFYAHPPPVDTYRHAIDQRAPTEYQRIWDTGYARVDAVKLALAAGYPVCFGTDLHERFVDSRDPGGVVWDPPTDSDRIAGGHAMVVIGNDGDEFKILNSWGSGWGRNGRCSFSADYIAWDGTRDLWIVESAPLYSLAA